jgi:putative endonuclease
LLNRYTGITRIEGSNPFLSATLLRAARYAGLALRSFSRAGDLKKRFADHNAGKSFHISKFSPWRLVTYVAFTDQTKATAFERYLKSGSGHAFARRHLW